MKHKQSSLTVLKISSVFSIKSNTDKIAALIRPLPPSTTPSKLILASHLEILLLQLAHKVLKEPHFILQKFSSQSAFRIYSATFNLPDIIISSKEISSKYLINGKYVNEELTGNISESSGNEKDLQMLSEEVVKYLCRYHGKIISCELEWFQYVSGEFYLVDVSNVVEGVTLAGRRIIRTVSGNMPMSSQNSRPCTARSNDKNFRFTQNTLHTEVGCCRSTRGTYTTPRSFKLSYEFPSKATQTTEGDCCQSKKWLAQCQIDLEKANEKKKILLKELENLTQENEEKIEKTNEIWTKKCFEISDHMAKKMHWGRKKHEIKMKNYMKTNE